MNTKHTPGPCTIEGTAEWGTDRGVLVIASEAQATCKVALINKASSTYSAANAKLIAAAPELLAALQAAKGLLEQIMPVFGSSHTETQYADETAAEIQAAIAAATA